MKTPATSLHHSRSFPSLLALLIGLIASFWLIDSLQAAAPTAVPASTQLQSGNSLPFDGIPNQLLEANSNRSIAWGDIDGDGDADLALGNDGFANLIYRNENGRFHTIAWTDGSSDNTTAVAFGDIDGDGDLDLVVGNSRQPTRLYRNDGLSPSGQPQLTLAWTEPASDNTRSLVLGDVDGNGTLDLVLGNWEAANKIYLNSGGTFANSPAWTDGESFQTNSVDLGDMDSDGDLDLAIANMCPNFPSSCDPDQVYENISSSGLAFDLFWQRTARSTTTVAWGDMDGDGDAELAVAENVYTTHKIYRHQGNNLNLTWASDVTEEDLGWAIAWADANGDGRLDLSVGTSFDAPERIYINAGSEPEKLSSWQTADTNRAYAIAWADINGDGALDMAVSYGNLIKFFTNNTHPLPGEGIDLGPQAILDTQAIVWGDIDNDGDLDLIEGNSDGANQIYLNDGSGQLDRLKDDLGSAATHSLALGDINGDGRLDLAVGNDGTPNQLYLNTGSGFANASVTPFGGSERTLGIAWGDADGDGDLDLVTANYQSANLLYLNNGGTLGTPVAIGSSSDRTTAVAFGDLDGDGDLDLAFAIDGAPNQLFRNDGGIFRSRDMQLFGQNEASTAVAFGDVDGDGDLDLAIANSQSPNHLYENVAGTLSAAPVWSSLDTNDTQALAFGDADGDGDLDLAVGNARGDGGGAVEPDKVYFNENGRLQTAAANIWIADVGKTGWLSTLAVAWADMDGDGDLDLATGGRDIGTSDGRTRLYLNQLQRGSSQTSGPQPIGAVIDLYSSGSTLANANFYAVPNIRDSGAVAIDYTLYHPDSQPARFVRGFYSLDGGDHWLPATPTAATAVTNLASSPYPSGSPHQFVWDVYQSGLFGQSDNVMFRLEALFDSAPPTTAVAPGTYPYTNAVSGAASPPALSPATFPFRVRGSQIQVISGTQPVPNALVYLLPAGQTLGADAIADAQGIPFRTDAFGFLQGRGQIAPGDQLMALQPVAQGGAPGHALQLDGLDDYANLGVASSTALTNDFTLSAWVKPDTVSGEQVILSHARTSSNNGFSLTLLNGGLRLTTHGVHTYDSSNIALRPGEWTHVAAVLDANNAVSFYIDGVFRETVTHDAPALPNTDDALLLGATTAVAATTRTNQFNGTLKEIRIWQTARTAVDLQAEINQTLPATDLPLLAGYWPLFEGEGTTLYDVSSHANDGTLGAAPTQPQWTTEPPPDPTYTVYHTSAAPTESGLAMTAVANELGIIQLTISPENTLTLFDLDVSLEWDARQDDSFLEQIRSDLARTSQILFDLSDGQAALGDIRIYQDKENWYSADVVVYATNSHRPNANLGGIVQSNTADTVNGALVDDAYLPGQVRMGANWNRFGNISGSLGEDWPRALAHELGHYAFFQLDDYLGIDNGLLIETNCVGSAMTDAYAYSELLSAANWTGDCLQTLAAQTTSRPDWDTVTTFYNWMSDALALDGPSNLPLNVTQIDFAPVAAADNTLAAPFFGLLDGAGSPLVFGEGEAQAFLFKTDGTAVASADVIALGAPNRDLVQARGAEPGDTLCVYGRQFTYRGCMTVGTQEAAFAVLPVADWTPQITVGAQTTTTIEVTVSNTTAVASISADLYPTVGEPLLGVVLTAVGNSADPTYTASIDLTTPTPGGIVRIQAIGTDGQPKEALTQFYLGSGWNVNRPGLNVNRPGLNVNRPGLNVNRPGLNVNRPGLNAPIASSDGQVIIFSLETLFSDTVTYSLQSLTALPELDSWLTPVGQGYRFTADGNVPDSSITFYYLQRDVPGGFEEALTLYFQPEAGGAWQRLETRRDTDRNFASAALQGNGTYVLAATIVTPGLQEGWNLFAYPDTDERSVPQALASIEGDYTSVYRQSNGEWLLYDATVLPLFDSLVNTLTTLQPLRAYWIYALRDTVPYIGIAGAAANQAQQLPPATYYGEVTAVEPNLTIGSSIVAMVGDVTCGEGEIVQVAADTYHYVIQVAADTGNDCGVNGRSILFVSGNLTATETVSWRNMQANYWPLTLGLGDPGEPKELPYQLYLPLVER